MTPAQLAEELERKVVELAPPANDNVPAIPGTRKDGARYLPITEVSGENGTRRYDVNGYGALSGNYFDTPEQANAFADALLTAMQDDGGNFYASNDASLAYANSLYNRITREQTALGQPARATHPATGTPAGNAARPSSAATATKPAPTASASLPFVAGQPTAQSVPTQQAPDTESQPQSFADLIMQNDAVRLRNKEAFDRREKADKARLTIAAVTDALASLGNLVGTTQGAFSQPQTYQVPFVHEDAERARAEARNTANMLLRNDQSLRVAQMREDSANSAAALRQALEEERTRRAQMNNDARVALAQENARLKGELYGTQHGYRTEEETQKQEGRMAVQESRNKQSDTNNRRTTATSRANTQDRIAAQQTNGGGKVGGYTTETTIHRDEYGKETGRTTTRTPANGGASTTTTTTTTSGSGKKPNPMGGAPKEEGKKKKKNPMA